LHQTTMKSKDAIHTALDILPNGFFTVQLMAMTFQALIQLISLCTVLMCPMVILEIGQIGWVDLEVKDPLMNATKNASTQQIVTISCETQLMESVESTLAAKLVSVHPPTLTM